LIGTGTMKPVPKGNPKLNFDTKEPSYYKLVHVTRYTPFARNVFRYFTPHALGSLEVS